MEKLMDTTRVADTFTSMLHAIDAKASMGERLPSLSRHWTTRFEHEHCS
jgi:hypothetical protein